MNNSAYPKPPEYPAPAQPKTPSKFPKKRGGLRSEWLWIGGIVVLVVAAVLIFVRYISDDSETKAAYDRIPISVAEAPAALSDANNFNLSLSGSLTGDGLRTSLKVEGRIHGNKIEDGVVMIDSRKYVMNGEILDDTYRFVCRCGQDIYVINVYPINGHFEGSATNLANHYDVILE